MRLWLLSSLVVFMGSLSGTQSFANVQDFDDGEFGLLPEGDNQDFQPSSVFRQLPLDECGGSGRCKRSKVPHPKNIPCACYKEFCICCQQLNLKHPPVHGKGCTSLKYLHPDTMRINMTLEGQHGYVMQFQTIYNPPPVCLRVARRRGELCASVRNVTKQEGAVRGCVRLETRPPARSASVADMCFVFRRGGHSAPHKQPPHRRSMAPNAGFGPIRTTHRDYFNINSKFEDNNGPVMKNTELQDKRDSAGNCTAKVAEPNSPTCYCSKKFCQCCRNVSEESMPVPGQLCLTFQPTRADLINLKMQFGDHISRMMESVKFADLPSQQVCLELWGGAGRLCGKVVQQEWSGDALRACVRLHMAPNVNMLPPAPDLCFAFNKEDFQHSTPEDFCQCSGDSCLCSQRMSLDYPKASERWNVLLQFVRPESVWVNVTIGDENVSELIHHTDFPKWACLYPKMSPVVALCTKLNTLKWSGDALSGCVSLDWSPQLMISMPPAPSNMCFRMVATPPPSSLCKCTSTRCLCRQHVNLSDPHVSGLWSVFVKFEKPHYLKFKISFDDQQLVVSKYPLNSDSPTPMCLKAEGTETQICTGLGDVVWTNQQYNACLTFGLKPSSGNTPFVPDMCFSFDTGENAFGSEPLTTKPDRPTTTEFAPELTTTTELVTETADDVKPIVHYLETTTPSQDTTELVTDDVTSIVHYLDTTSPSQDTTELVTDDVTSIVHYLDTTSPAQDTTELVTDDVNPVVDYLDTTSPSEDTTELVTDDVKPVVDYLDTTSSSEDTTEIVADDVKPMVHYLDTTSPPQDTTELVTDNGKTTFHYVDTTSPSQVEPFCSCSKTNCHCSQDLNLSTYIQGLLSISVNFEESKSLLINISMGGHEQSVSKRIRPHNSSEHVCLELHGFDACTQFVNVTWGTDKVNGCLSFQLRHSSDGLSFIPDECFEFESDAFPSEPLTTMTEWPTTELPPRLTDHCESTGHYSNATSPSWVGPFCSCSETACCCRQNLNLLNYNIQGLWSISVDHEESKSLLISMTVGNKTNVVTKEISFINPSERVCIKHPGGDVCTHLVNVTWSDETVRACFAFRLQPSKGTLHVPDMCFAFNSTHQLSKEPDNKEEMDEPTESPERSYCECVGMRCNCSEYVIINLASTEGLWNASVEYLESGSVRVNHSFAYLGSTAKDISIMGSYTKAVCLNLGFGLFYLCTRLIRVVRRDDSLSACLTLELQPYIGELSSVDDMCFAFPLDAHSDDGATLSPPPHATTWPPGIEDYDLDETELDGRRRKDKCESDSGCQRPLLSDPRCSCHENSCKCCLHMDKAFAPAENEWCVVMENKEQGFLRVNVSFKNNHGKNKSENIQLMAHQEEVPVCVKVPGGMIEACGVIFDIERYKGDFKSCLKVQARYFSEVLESVKSACFHIGHKNSRSTTPSQHMEMLNGS